MDFQIAKQTLVNEGCPPDIAAEAAEVLVQDAPGKERTPEQQAKVTKAWRYVVGLPPEDGAVLGGSSQ